MNDLITAHLDTIRDLQRKKTANAEAHEKTVAIIAMKADEIIALKASTPADVAGRLAVQREDLLARKALGDATDADLQKFDKDADATTRKFKEQSAKMEALKPLEATLAGLQRELKRLDAERSDIKAETMATWLRYLRELAEQAGAEYRAHAERAFKPLLRVLNCGALIHRLEGHPNAIGMGAREFNIPPLGTESTALPPPPKYSLGEDQNLFSVASDENMRKRVDPDEVALFAEFKAAGLEWIGPAPKVAAPVAVVEPAAVNILTKPAGILSTIAEKPRKVPPGAATLVDPKNPNALCGPGFNPRPTCAEID